MERMKDTYLETIQTVFPLTGKRVLEVGCGDGSRTIQIAQQCSEVVAIDPDIALILQAQGAHERYNISYQEGSANELLFDSRSFDVVFFTLSFHHIPIEHMNKSINEALRVVKLDGGIVFFEPSFDGSFFDAEIQFDACDGDERKEKAAAYAAMLSHPGLNEVCELHDETVFTFDDQADFIKTMHPKQNRNEELLSFLHKHHFILHANRRINIFRPRLAS